MPGSIMLTVFVTATEHSTSTAFPPCIMLTAFVTATEHSTCTDV